MGLPFSETGISDFLYAQQYSNLYAMSMKCLLMGFDTFLTKSKEDFCLI